LPPVPFRLRAPLPGRSPRLRLPQLLGLLLALLISWGGLAAPASAALDDDRYDGNIFALYAGNGSLVPPRNSLAEALAAGRVTVLVFYLDDNAPSKGFAPVVSELQRHWGNAIELIPLVTDPLQNRRDDGERDPAHYWTGSIPQVVVLDSQARVVFDASGAVPLEQIDQAISQATGIPLPEGMGTSDLESFNELNREVVSR